MAANPGHGFGKLGDRVVRLQHRAVTGRAARSQPQPRHALFRGLQEVKALVSDGYAEPADLADSLRDTLEQVRVLVDEVARAPGASGLLVRGEGEHDVAGGLTVFALTLADHGQDHRVH